MASEQPPRKFSNINTYKISAIILDVNRTILEISQHYQKHNDEFRQSKKKKIRESLEQYLLDDKIIKDFVQQLAWRKIWFERTETDSSSLKRYGCKVIDQRSGLVYLIIFFLDDDNPKLVKVITAHPSDEEWPDSK